MAIRTKDEDSLAVILEKRKSQFEAALGGVIPVEHFLRTALTIATRTPEIQKCDKASIYLSLLDAATMGLEPNTPAQECALVPFGGKCSIMVMRSGWVKMARRGSDVEDLAAQAIYEGELNMDAMREAHRKDPMLSLGELALAAYEPRFDLGFDDEAPRVVAAIAIVTYKSGGRGVEVLRRHQINRTRARALANKKPWQLEKSPWNTDEDRMAEKSVLNRLIRSRLALNSSLARALEVTDREMGVADPVPEAEPEETAAEPARQISASAKLLAQVGVRPPSQRVIDQANTAAVEEPSTQELIGHPSIVEQFADAAGTTSKPEAPKAIINGGGVVPMDSPRVNLGETPLTDEEKKKLALREAIHEKRAEYVDIVGEKNASAKLMGLGSLRGDRSEQFLLSYLASISSILALAVKP